MARGRPGPERRLIDIRPILSLVGFFLAMLAGLMLVPALVDAASGEPDWQAFVGAAAVTSFVGVSLILTNRQTVQVHLNRREAFLLTSMVWLAAAAFGALPLAAAGLGLSYTDAFFEAMSGITTTGSTVMVGLDGAPPGVLLWRALLQWLGGIGFIALGIAVLPALRIGGMQLFQTESSDRSEKILPRAAQVISAIATLYVTLTGMCAIAYGLAGMDGFDAVTHAMTTVATAGYSNHDTSLAYFQSPAIEWIATVFMVSGGIPFVLYVRFVRGDRRALWRDTQVRWYLSLLLGASLAIATWLALTHALPPLDALRVATFNVVSVVTTTGYYSADYATWGPFTAIIFFFLMFAGGCTGSTAGGIKTFRYGVLYAQAVVQLRRLMQPHGAFVPLFNGRPIPDQVAISVLAFFFLFALCTVALAVLLAALGLDFVTSLSGAATVMNNVGPGLGTVIGPVGNFSTLPDSAKWALAFGMLLGRLELFTLLVFLLPSFWRG